MLIESYYVTCNIISISNASTSAVSGRLTLTLKYQNFGCKRLLGVQLIFELNTFVSQGDKVFVLLVAFVFHVGTLSPANTVACSWYTLVE